MNSFDFGVTFPSPDLLRMFFDCLYDEDVISEDAFYKWESSKDPAEQDGKGVALKSVTAFFTWLREAEEESEDNWRGRKLGGTTLVELHPYGRINIQNECVCDQDNEFTAGIFFCGTVLRHAAILSLDSSDGSTKYLYYK